MSNRSNGFNPYSYFSGIPSNNGYGDSASQSVFSRALGSSLTPTAPEFTPRSYFGGPSYGSGDHNVADIPVPHYPGTSSSFNDASAQNVYFRNNMSNTMGRGFGDNNQPVDEMRLNNPFSFSGSVSNPWSTSVGSIGGSSIWSSGDHGDQSWCNEQTKTERDASGCSNSNGSAHRNGENYKNRHGKGGGAFNKSLTFENTRYKNKGHFKDKRFGNSSNFKDNQTSIDTSKVDASVCQRDHLTEQLKQGTLECLVCCERVKQVEPVWSCNNCYHVLHFWCINRWAKSSKSDDDSWRCPACQNPNQGIPAHYTCFCGKTRLRTEWNRLDIPHSCGEICSRAREDLLPGATCIHRCILLCHPGPCPPCTVQVKRECGCGKTKKIIQCGSSTPVLCKNICDKVLNCGVHHCTKFCHIGECDPCDLKVKLECYCGKTSKEEKCETSTNQSKFSCQLVCGRKLSCGNHTCPDICHEGECKPCSKIPSTVKTCPCGKTELSGDKQRTSCTDPVPTCDNTCGKLLPCGSPNKPHFCEMKCHEGECGPCKKQTMVKCHCGSKDKLVACVELSGNASDFRCKKKCTKKRNCGKHKCNKACCIDPDHICPLRCTGTLNCGKHRCELLCHRGKCGNCLQSSFEELYCHCGSTVMYPPIACGTRPPVCDKPCARTHDCEHFPLHTCHSNRTCPPCTIFTDKYCYGQHELRRTVPCHQKEFSCGRPCGKLLLCGAHTCEKPCHPGACQTLNEKCTQLCRIPRNVCGHPCNTPCHAGNGPCPNVPCKEMVKVSCICGNRVSTERCADHTDEYQQLLSSMVAVKIGEARASGAINVFDLPDKVDPKKVVFKTLECNEECSIIMRNRRLAMCLQIQNAEVSSKIIPRYSDFMKQWAKKDPNFCTFVHDKLVALVHLAKESKQKSRSYSFEIMNREKRQFVHEYCAHFGCESQAYDAEPKRNIVATAVKDKCSIPSFSLVEVVQREMGVRKVHVPSFGNKKNKNTLAKPSTTSANMVILPVQNLGARPPIDYFNDPM